MSRTRVLARDGEFGGKVLDRIERYVMGNRLSGSEIREIVDIQRRMETQQRSGGQLSIKTGPGGIVDIEFLVQILQIQHGGESPQLRSPNTLVSLGRLEEAGILIDEEAEHLRDTFIFLRSIEKVLRRQDERATTRLPSNDRNLVALSRAVGFARPDDFIQTLHQKMGKTREAFQTHLGDATQ